MPTYETPEAITAILDLTAADVRVTATGRPETVVEVRPTDPSADADVRAAEQTQVEYASGHLRVKGPRLKRGGLIGKPGSVTLTIELPAASQLEAHAGVGAIRGAGTLGDCRIKIGAGDIHVEHAAALDAYSGAGDISVDAVAGRAELTARTGRIRVRQIDGSADLKNSGGDTWVGEVVGDLRVRAANGDIRVDRAHAGVRANTANGRLQVGDLTRGASSLRTAKGEIEIGIHAGTAARLHVNTKFGRVENQLTASDSPGPSDETAEVRASTNFGDIVIRRAS